MKDKFESAIAIVIIVNTIIHIIGRTVQTDYVILSRATKREAMESQLKIFKLSSKIPVESTSKTAGWNKGIHDGRHGTTLLPLPHPDEPEEPVKYPRMRYISGFSSFVSCASTASGRKL